MLLMVRRAVPMMVLDSLDSFCHSNVMKLLETKMQRNFILHRVMNSLCWSVMEDGSLGEFKKKVYTFFERLGDWEPRGIGRREDWGRSTTFIWNGGAGWGAEWPAPVFWCSANWLWVGWNCALLQVQSFQMQTPTLMGKAVQRCGEAMPVRCQIPSVQLVPRTQQPQHLSGPVLRWGPIDWRASSWWYLPPIGYCCERRLSESHTGTFSNCVEKSECGSNKRNGEYCRASMWICELMHW